MNLVVVLTNMSLVPVAISMWNHDKYYEALMMIGAFVTSFMYHFDEVPGVLMDGYPFDWEGRVNLTGNETYLE